MVRYALHLALLSLSLVAASAPTNLFSWQGLEPEASVRPQNIDTTTDQEFMAFSQGIHEEDGLWSFDIPRKDPRQNYRYVGLGPFPVEALHRYRLSFRMTRAYGDFTILFTATFLQAGQHLMFRPVVNLPGDAWMSDTGVSQDFASPPQADGVILWLGVSGNGKPVTPGVKMILHDVHLEPVGIMDGNPQVNGQTLTELAPDFDLTDKPLGPLITKDGHFGGPGKEVTLTVVELETGKALHVQKPEDAYTFPHVRLAELPYDNCWLRYRFLAKGSGQIAAGMWWMRGARIWSYGAGSFVELTDEWQEVTYLRACTDATARGGAIAFHLGKGPAEVMIRDLSVAPVTPAP